MMFGHYASSESDSDTDYTEEEIIEEDAMFQERETAQRLKDKQNMNKWYLSHDSLIKKAETMKYKELALAVKALPVKPHYSFRFGDDNRYAIPEYENNTIFKSILTNSHLSERQKSKVLKILIEQKGMHRYFQNLLDEFLSSQYVHSQSGECRALLLEAYLYSIANYDHIYPVAVEAERQLWSLYFEYPEVIRMIYMSLDYSFKKYQLLCDGLRSKTTATEVIDAYEYYAKHFPMIDAEKSIFMKIAKQKILEIELAQKSIIHRNQDNAKVERFLNTARDEWKGYCFCLFKPRSIAIHQMIDRGESPQAQAAWEKENKKIRISS